MPKRTNPEIEKAIVLGYKTGLGSIKLAKKFKCNPCTVLGIVKRNGAEIRPRKIIDKKTKKKILKEYVAGKKSSVIACRYGLHPHTVPTIAEKNGIFRGSSIPRFFDKKQAKRIIKKYNGGKSTVELAKKYKVSDSCIWKTILRNGGKMRNAWDYKKKCAPFEIKIKEEYVGGKRSGILAKEYGVCIETIARIVKKHGGKIRSQKGWQKDALWLDNLARSLNRRPNKQEKHLNLLLRQNFPKEYLYTGGGKHGSIFGKIPDFTNVNGRKEFIELFGLHWHDPNYFPNRMNEKELIKYYAKFGWKTLIVWENELRDEERLLEKIKEFRGVD